MARFDQLTVFTYGVARGDLVENREERGDGEHRHRQCRQPRNPAGAAPVRRDQLAWSRSAHSHRWSIGPYSAHDGMSSDAGHAAKEVRCALCSWRKERIRRGPPHTTVSLLGVALGRARTRLERNEGSNETRPPTRPIAILGPFGRHDEAALARRVHPRRVRIRAKEAVLKIANVSRIAMFHTIREIRHAFTPRFRDCYCR